MVKTEKGHWSGGDLLCRGLRSDSVKVFYEPFTVLREAIDNAEGEKPVPRIEVTDNGRYDLQFRTYMGDSHKSFTPEAFNALSQLAGKPLPVWKDGKWERLNTHDWTEAKKVATERGYGISTFSFEESICPVRIWRYTR